MQFLNLQGSVVNMMHSVNRIEEEPCLSCYRGKSMKSSDMQPRIVKNE
jgi:hypothetical protein